MKYKSIIFAVILLAAVNACNPASVNVPDRLCTGIHSVRNNEICHGAKYLDPAGYCSEANCHGSNLRGGNTGAPSCYACHGPYWEVKTLHIVDILGHKHHRDVCTSTDFTATCGDPYCHGPALTGTNQYMKAPGCNKCHGIPTASGDNCVFSGIHTVNIDGHMHGNGVGTSFDTCKNQYCHGVSLTGGTGSFPGPSCGKCHDIPSGPGGAD